MMPSSIWEVIFVETCELQAKFINKVLGTLLTKLVNENRTYWDEHLSTMLFSYKIAYKVAIGYTPY
jgi:hypothetical protein